MARFTIITAAAVALLCSLCTLQQADAGAQPRVFQDVAELAAMAGGNVTTLGGARLTDTLVCAKEKIAYAGTYHGCAVYTTAGSGVSVTATSIELSYMPCLFKCVDLDLGNSLTLSCGGQNGPAPVGFGYSACDYDGSGTDFSFIYNDASGAHKTTAQLEADDDDYSQCSNGTMAIRATSISLQVSDRGIFGDAHLNIQLLAC